MWWPNHIVPAHVSRVAKNIACCVWKTAQDCISVCMLWRFEIWENYFNSHTIITIWWGLSLSRYILKLPHLLKYMLAIIFKAFLIFLLFIFFAYFCLSKSCMGIYEREEIPHDDKHLTFQFCYAEAHKCHWHCTFAMPKHTSVILWLANNSGEMVIYAFLLGFSSPSHQKEWYEC